MQKQIDVRGPRFGAAITTVVLAIALVALPSALSSALLAWQTLAFGLGAFVGLHAAPYGVLFRKIVVKRVGPATKFEDVQPPRFAQLVGFGFAAVALCAALSGLTLVAQIATGLALGAAFLNSVFAICLGCEMYVIGKRLLNH